MILLYQYNINKVDAIYDCVLCLRKNDNGAESSMLMIKDGIPLKPQMLVNRIPIKDVPIDDEKKCSEFLYKMYSKKVNTTK